jgi:hypothetical protein
MSLRQNVIENVEKSYKGRTSMLFLTVKQPLRLNYSQINSKLFWHCHQSLVKLAEHKTIQQVRVLGSMGIDGKKYSTMFITPIHTEPALSISTNIARGMIRGWTSRRHKY